MAQEGEVKRGLRKHHRHQKKRAESEHNQKRLATPAARRAVWGVGGHNHAERAGFIIAAQEAVYLRREALSLQIRFQWATRALGRSLPAVALGRQDEQGVVFVEDLDSGSSSGDNVLRAAAG